MQSPTQAEGLGRVYNKMLGFSSQVGDDEPVCAGIYALSFAVYHQVMPGIM